MPSFCRAAGKESGESLLGKGGGLGRKPAASNVAEGYDFCIKLKLCRIPIVDFRAAAGDDRFSEESFSLVAFPDSDYGGVYNPSGASLVLSKQTVGLHDGTLWYFIFDRLICSLYIGFCGLSYYVMRSLNCVLYPTYLPALFEVLMQSFEIIVRQGLLHGDLAKRAKHFFTESARVCAGTQNSVCLSCLHIAPYIKVLPTLQKTRIRCQWDGDRLAQVLMPGLQGTWRLLESSCLNQALVPYTIMNVVSVSFFCLS